MVPRLFETRSVLIRGNTLTNHNKAITDEFIIAKHFNNFSNQFSFSEVVKVSNIPNKLLTEL